MQELDGLAAFGQTLRNAARRFPDRKDARHAGQMLMPEVRPGFSLGPGDSVFTIGSCFARNVEDALLARGLRVPTARFSAPEGEAPGRPNRILNQYNPGTMLQCLRDIDTGETGAGLYAQGDGVIDCLLAT
ncbi:GSCFA domain-containing protein, partial [Oceanicola sp. S124]|uniref:GSCFA domain-containing protein n=1 Tax=Oceanicola sp. S124 TaxID=1042378 RepID=UPI0002558143